MISGHAVVAKALAQQEIQYSFGIVGVPVIELGYSLQANGIQYYGFRNEQAASYAASVVGYLTQKPGICMVVSGPGLIHALAGAANAQTNGWPMVIVAGASDMTQQGQGSFQEYDQMNAIKQYVKFSAKITSMKYAPQLIQQAVKISMVGRPGCTYIEIPGDLLRAEIPESSLVWPQPFRVTDIPACIPPQDQIVMALSTLKLAKNPLVVIGKACAMTGAEHAITNFINSTGIPFLPTPMGKGVVADDHPNNISPARSTALQQADVVLVLGARLNWILHFGLPPRLRSDVKIIQVDICPEEFNTNVRGTLNLYGDIKLVVELLTSGFKSDKFQFDPKSQWWNTLHTKSQANRLANQELITDMSLPLQYYSSIGIIQSYLPTNAIVIGEGSNTMDIGRTIITHQLPRSKLDSGTFATMGVGMGYCIAAKAIHPDRPVYAVVGDSAFGFSAMEIETATRYNLPIVVIIINNNGIFMGVDEISENTKNIEIPVTALNPLTEYEKLGDAFGARGILVNTHEELHAAMKEIAANSKRSYVVNVKISPMGQKKPQEHVWLSQSKI